MILRRLRENRIEGYTLEMSKEIARIAALTAPSQPASAPDAEQIGLRISDNVIDHMRSYITRWSALNPEDVSEIEAGVRSIIVAEIETAWPQPSTYEGKAEPVAYERMRDGLLVDVWQYETAEDDQSGYRPLYAHPPAQPAPAVDREAIARVIDPEIDILPKLNLYAERLDAAYAKADAILSLLPRAQPSSEEGGR